MQLQQILKQKGADVRTVDPSATLMDVVQRLVAHNCGSLVVCEGEQMVGIITERDILRTLDQQSASLSELTVRDHMSANVITASPTDLVGATMGLLTHHRIRHLPVVQEGKLAGMISIGDLVKAQHDQLSMENQYLINYIQS